MLVTKIKNTDDKKIKTLVSNIEFNYWKSERCPDENVSVYVEKAKALKAKLLENFGVVYC